MFYAIEYMKKNQVKDTIRKTFRREYGFSPRPSDITVLEITENEDKYNRIFCYISEFIEKLGNEVIKSPGKYYLLEYDGFNLYRADENGNILNPDKYL